MEQNGFVFSPQYVFVRGRELEGTFPGNGSTGIWPVTALRIGHGWGIVPEDVWQYETSIWPPIELAGVDAIARDYRLNTYYRRVRTLQECKTALALLQVPIFVALEITDAWYYAPNGKIPALRQSDVSTGSHSVLLVGYDDRKAEFKFQNSWGGKWGDHGFGYISYDRFRSTCIESWTELPGGDKVWIEPKSGVAQRSWGVREVTGGILHCREFVAVGKKTIAWMYAVERDGALEVEELFVMPQFRFKGYGKKLTHLTAALASEKSMPLRYWLSHADATPNNLAIVERLLRPLQVRPSGERWASYVVSN